jgi:hypothetical protein
MLGRALLILGGTVLLGTAGFHASGGPSVANWLPGERGAVVQALWYLAAVDWAVVGLAWLFVAWRGDRRLAPLVWLLALAPAAAAALIAAVLGPAFIGIWLLAGATLLAVLGSIALPRS